MCQFATVYVISKLVRTPTLGVYKNVFIVCYYVTGLRKMFLDFTIVWFRNSVFCRTSSPTTSIAEKEPIVRDRLPMQHADDGYIRRDNFSRSLVLKSQYVFF